MALLHLRWGRSAQEAFATLSKRPLQPQYPILPPLQWFRSASVWPFEEPALQYLCSQIGIDPHTAYSERGFCNHPASIATP